MIIGVQYSTDSRDDGRETFERFRSTSLATAWRDSLGIEGVGPSFAPDNGHRYIRILYDMPTGWRRPRQMRWGDVQGNGDRID